MSSGTIVSIIGAVIDVEFPRNEVPQVYNALTVDDWGLVLEVQGQLGDGVVLANAGHFDVEIDLEAIDGPARGLDGALSRARGRPRSRSTCCSRRAGRRRPDARPRSLPPVACERRSSPGRCAPSRNAV